MTTASGNKDQYDEMAAEYSSYEELPMARLEAELIRTALGDCTGLTVLDLGGGSGTHARQAVRAGAKQVDVVDISDAMMEIGKAIEAKSPETSRIRWLLADASKPIVDQGVDVPDSGYDIAMANWVFDHAHTVDDLRGMWTNMATTLKPGGRFIGIRVVGSGIYEDYVAKTGKYGCKFTDVEEIPGGLGCNVTLMTDPPFSFGGTLMDDSYNMVNRIPRELGFTDIELVPDAESEVVKANPEFWKEHLEKPLFAVVTARKA